MCFLCLAVLVCYISWKTSGPPGSSGGQWVNMEPTPSAFNQDSPLFKPLITENQNPLFTSQKTI